LDRCHRGDRTKTLHGRAARPAEETARHRLTSLGRKRCARAYHEEMARVRQLCREMPAWGMPRDWAPPPDTTGPLPVVPTPVRPGPLPSPFRTRPPCRVLPALAHEIVAAYARPA